jgi:enoyl-CoA hydratase
MFQVEPHGGKVALLRMDDGKVNAMGPPFLDAFAKAWGDATRDGRAVVIAGNAKAFCAGLDLRALPALDRAGLAAFVRGFNRLFHDVWTHPRPVVAAVDGPALAGGAVLALCCDQRVVAPGARLGLTETLVGVPFPAPVLELCRATLPANEHGPAILGAAIRQGAQAVERGWAHRSVDSGDRLVPDALALAAELAALDAEAYRAAKEGLNAPAARVMEAFLKEGADAYTDRLARPETMQAIVANFQRVAGKR